MMSDKEEAIQLIDEQKKFHTNYWDYFKQCIADRNVGLNYHVISVFGSQSSGKSTLLNTLFNTKFDTMDAQFKRQQTTKGIWLAHTRNVNTLTKSEDRQPTADLFVLDVEGSDGAERGEDQDFERKAALFAISVSEVLIVNMWEQQIGLYQGNNMALLKTVFEVNLSLFGKSTNGHKVLLLFVIRDHVGVTPLESLRDSLQAELEKIWSGLNKPTECSDSSLYDFFDLQFVGLAHKLLQPKEFIENVQMLGDCFVYPEHKPYYFKKEYHHNLPLEGWSMYAENCWEQIENNKDLDLPTQQILVSTFKTEEIASEAFNDFTISYEKNVPLVIEDKEELIDLLKTLRDSCLEQYDDQASRYTESVYLEKRNDLTERMNENFTETIEIFMENLSKVLLTQLATDLNKKQDRDVPFSQRSKEVAIAVVNEYKMIVMEFFDSELLTSPEELITHFDKSLVEELKRLSDEEIKTIITRANKKITLTIKEDAIRLLSNPERDVWDCIMEKFDGAIQDALIKYANGAEKPSQYDFQVGVSGDENQKIYQKIRHNAWHLLNVTVHDYLKEDTVVGILRERFEKKFRYDDHDSPRLWKNEDEIDQAFRVAKEYALAVLDVLSIATTTDNVEIVAEFNEDEDGDEDEYYKDDVGIYHSRRFAHILNELQKEKILQQFRRQINITVLDSKRSIIKTTTSIPIWIYILLVALGWNEFMMVIRNPLFVTLTLISIVGFYFVNKFGLWGPVLNVAQSAVGETRTTIKAKLRNFVLDEHETSQKQVPETFEMQDMSDEEKD